MAKYTDNVDGTITDNKTGLMWQKATAPDEYTWEKALRYCKDLKLAGHTDWRLPNIKELQSIVDYEKRDPAIDSMFDAKSLWYWSSTSFERHADQVWLVDFSLGSVTYENKPYEAYVRAVRGEKTTNYVRTEDEPVTRSSMSESGNDDIVVKLLESHLELVKLCHRKSSNWLLGEIAFLRGLISIKLKARVELKWEGEE